ncbi:WAP four-disulfide core domain protein 2-like isoform X2 [Hyla sarda]|uniref:WAP four-disulfide core domain protein 2-like isoform X2 n=1 Tax=Hyla sarda TaxID=327740 RepID=UPI0024C46D16|nr:WAP four-disulfide core domain protein 2-like isoform X2 [Hyla sarda]
MTPITVTGVQNTRKPGGCPEAENEYPIYSTCSDLCKDEGNCMIQSCVSDSSCEGSLKCCKTKCGAECLPPVFRSPCQNNFDCPLTLKCCSGVCDNDCVYQPRIPYPTN